MPDGFSTKLSVIAPNDVWVPQAIAVQEALKELNIEVEIVQYALRRLDQPSAGWRL